METDLDQMRAWMLAHDPFLREEPDRERYLEIMLTMAVGFALVEGVGLGAKIRSTGHGIALEGGPPVEIAGELRYILTAVVFYYGLAYERLAQPRRIAGYNYLLSYDEDPSEEPLDDALLKAFMEDAWKWVQRSFGRSYPFDRRAVYKRYGKVFLCTRPVDEAELEQMAQDCRHYTDQDLFEVFWDEDGVRRIF